jgi:prepilin-type processing-associated H-X9-DG protein
LWQFGQALLQYSQQQGVPISQLAERGNLTPTGIFAAGRIKEGFSAEAGEKSPYSEDWLAAENSLRFASFENAEDLQGSVPFSPRENRVSPESLVPVSLRENSDSPQPLKALLVDAPLADFSAEAALAVHGGQGRNVFYADGHAGLVPCRMISSPDAAFLTQAADLISLR